MRIGIDARLYAQTGVGRYLRNLIAHLQIIDQKNDYIIYLRSQEFDLVSDKNKKWQKRKVDIPWHTVSEQIKFPFILSQDSLDVAHFPYFNVPVLYPGKYLLTIHDLIVDHFDTGRASTLPYPFYFLKRLGYKTSLSLAVKKAKIITAISNSTKKEIMDHYGVENDKIILTFDALDEKFSLIAKNKKKENYYDFPYILYVGNAYPHKNIERLIGAFKIIRESKNIKLVLAGDDDYFYPRLKKFAKSIGLERETIFFGEANDSELVNLYSNALCLVFPSLMEGFGLPSLEAVACGVLPVMSDIAVFRELWGNHLNFFDPNNEKNMAEEILRVISLDKSSYLAEVADLKKTVEKFSWRKTAQITLMVYEKIFQAK